MEYIGKILTLSKSIFWMIAEVKANRKRCERLAERVKSLEELVEAIKRRGPGQISSTTERALWKLCMTLTTAQELVRKCTKTKFPNLFKCKGEFKSVNESLNDTFQVLSGALQVEQGSMMRRMIPAYTVEEDDDDWEDGLGLFGAMAPVPYGAMAPVRYPAAAAPMPLFAAPRPQPTSVAMISVLEVEDDSVCYTEAVFFAQ